MGQAGRPWTAGAGALRRWAVTPGLAAFVLWPRLQESPHPAYRLIRQVDPVHHSPLGVWILSRHAEVQAVLRDARSGSDERRADPGALRPLQRATRILSRGAGSEEAAHGPALRAFSEMMLFRDPPDHTRLRRLANRAFTPRVVEELAPRTQRILDDLLDPLMERRRMDVIGDVAYVFPARVICELMGVRTGDHELFIRHAPALAAGLDPAPLRSPEVTAAANRAVDELGTYLRRLISVRRSDPGPDLLSSLIAAEEAGDRLTEDELVSTGLLLLTAGHETTANLLGNGLHALLTDRPQWARLVAEPGLERSAVEELLRLHGPVHMAQRVALEPMRLGDHDVAEGAMLVLLLAAANRDPAVFPAPDQMILDRQPNPHLAFSAGAHYCLGAALARLEAQQALRSLADRLPGMRLVSGRPEHRPSFTLHGLRRLEVAW